MTPVWHFISHFHISSSTLYFVFSTARTLGYFMNNDVVVYADL